MKFFYTFQLSLIAGLICSISSLNAQSPNFTGNARADFLAISGYHFFNDFTNDVGIPNAAPLGTASGWDIETTFFYYDDISDDLYVGIDFTGIFGDADGDGNPSTTSTWLNNLNGTDHPDLSNTEAFILAFDNDKNGVYDFFIGVSRIGVLIDIAAYNYSAANLEAPESFPVAAASNNVQLFSATPNAAAPDLEFAVSNISNSVDICDTNFAVFAGSFADGPIGEDYYLDNLSICTALPVSLTAFDAQLSYREVQVEWMTETESNSDHFVVEYANDLNTDFKTIAEVDAAGNSNSPLNYSILHDTPVYGNNYYRLKQVNTDGTAWYSWVITQQYEIAGSVIEVYPNPNKGHFRIGLPTSTRDASVQLRIMDNKGSVVFSEKTGLKAGRSSVPVDVSHLNPGIYYISMHDELSDKTYYERFILH